MGDWSPYLVSTRILRFIKRDLGKALGGGGMDDIPLCRGLVAQTRSIKTVEYEWELHFFRQGFKSDLDDGVQFVFCEWF